MVDVMVTGQDPVRATGERAQPPIRWPRPDRPTLTLVGLWAVGVFVALFVPALFVAPTAKNPPAGQVWLAFSSTVIGAIIMLASVFALWRRNRDSAVFVLGTVPAVACVAGGIILAATKLLGTTGSG
jgi:hypothetical protein